MSDFALTCAIEKAQKYYTHTVGKERQLWFKHLEVLLMVREIRLITKVKGDPQ